ncbi:hypothetical protein Acr_12g0001140 [Actinidia rufa]|uniref:CCHC-type domain-containing protein n=1 Tax=Actinidia rufa TaxID=165716 RepID=A0A7J0FG52_9ERIC|nr:hypothetical protein Acr_12g0001140 [Actinidia rufa]
MPPRRKPRRGRPTNLARGPRGRGRDTRLQDEGSQHDGNPGGRGARLEQEGNNPGGNGTPNQFVVDFVATLAAANILNQPRWGSHDEWWESVLAARRDARRVAKVAENVEAPDIENLTWAEFEKMFENQYFPESYREQLRDKFEKFEQGNMTLSEYITQYQALSRFAPELVNTEEKKCRRFEKARTLELPRDNVRNARGNEGRQSMGSGGMASDSQGSQSRKRQRDTFQPTHSQQSFRAPFSTGFGGHSLRPPVTCHQCGQEGHIRAHCPQTPSQLRPPPPPRSQTPGACFGCGGFGHVARGTQSQPHYRQTTTGQGPQGDRGASSSALNPTTQGRVFTVTTAAPPPPPVIATQTLEASIVRGTFLLFNSFAGVLFDSGASHSFIAASFVLALGLETEELNPPLFVDTPIGGRTPLDRICSGGELVILDHHFVFDFIVLGMSGFDLILGMDWLSTFCATIDCFKRRVRICTLEGGCLEYFGERQESSEPYLYEPRDKGSITYLLASLTLDEDLSTRGELLRVVCDFPDIFPEELSGLPPRTRG